MTYVDGIQSLQERSISTLDKQHTDMMTSTSTSRAYLEVALVGVQNDHFVLVESALQLNSSMVNGRLEITVFSIHHQTHSPLREVHACQLQVVTVVKYSAKRHAMKLHGEHAKQGRQHCIIFV